jgi:hypothetical protein
MATMVSKLESNRHKIGDNKQVIAQCKKPTRKWHIWFFLTHEPTLKKPKEPFFANARTGKRKE